MSQKSSSSLSSEDNATQGDAAASSESEVAIVEPDPEPEVLGEIVTLAAGDTLADVLAERGVSAQERFALSKAVSEYKDLRRLRPGDRMEILLTPEEKGKQRCVKRFRLVTDEMTLVEIRHDGHCAFTGSLRPIKHDTYLKSVSASIDSSFYLSARQQGVSRKIFTEFYNMLSARVDFQRSIRKGDTFSVVYEENDCRPLGTIHPGRLLYASLTHMGESIGYYRYTTMDGFSGFFDEDGQSLDTQLLKTPLSDGVLSSLFGKRKHPVLGYTRMHRGVDFSARYGTPILAAGDGIVEWAAWRGSFGRYVKLRHGNGFQTAYAHMSRIAKGMRPGVKVQQGDIIGYVGTSGVSTGPHLHYEVLRNGRQINPSTLKLPPARVLQGEDLRRFKERIKEFQGPIVGPPDLLHAQLS
ncbi:peptidoglycan DD-metalloendopeptidase family protein [Pseudodesulfovibrio sp. zrk46]|uniref:M23 family metallopeptidase n=1 Tax=Pseudodesulfovibrio sp. zrk46 TaxID=2725288 RepID=UPI00144933F9|nr:peptidoglycan DD-metalloendopeptidase family protein [Pseudodesulfovibrio sp. zrk46]QJB56057.1 peptidoglycan DD-metalloendopeptidase family protein [Pseudodesulfovibrio sp. zrk46]